MLHKKRVTLLGRLLHYVLVLAGAGSLTLTFFLVLPLIQAITKQPTDQLMLRSVDTGYVPPPPTVEPEPEPEDEPEEEEPPPELEEQRLDLSQLELALSDSLGTGGAGSFTVKLDGIGAGGKDKESIFSMTELDQRPRAIAQPAPRITGSLRKKLPGRVVLIFIVDQNGRVQRPKVFQTTDPALNAPALAAIKKWKWEPGKRNGKPVQFRVRQPLSFPKG